MNILLVLLILLIMSIIPIAIINETKKVIKIKNWTMSPVQYGFSHKVIEKKSFLIFVITFIVSLIIILKIFN